MDTFLAAALPAIAELLRPEHLGHLLLGVLIGLAVGLLPGIGGMAGMAMVMPFLYGMDPTSALAMIVGLTAVTNTSDTIPAILLGIPGSASAQATVVDGYPLAKRGEAGRALSASFAASMLGGIFGALILTMVVLVAKPLLLTIGFGEQLIILLIALASVGTLTGASPLSGLAACAIGLLIGAVGTAPATGEERMTFGSLYLIDGIPLVPIGLGLFAVPEVLSLIRHRERIAERTAIGAQWLRGLRDVWIHRGVVLRCSGLGAALGIVPGVGGSIIDWVAYSHTVQSARDRSLFGKGDIRGVLAPEAANNSKEGGGLIPTLLFGVPGSGTMAMFLAAMVIIGVEPGRSMVEVNLQLTFVIIWSIALANVAGSSISAILALPLAWLITIRFIYLAPFVIVLIVLAAYQARGSWGDLVTMLAFGLLGIGMTRFGWSKPALLVGFVLAPSLEAMSYRTLSIYGGSFLGRPAVLFLLVVLAVAVAWAARGRCALPVLGLANGMTGRLPGEIAFAVTLLAASSVAFLESLTLRDLGRYFPLGAAAASSLLLLLLVASLLRKPPQNPADAELELGSSEAPLLPVSGLIAGFVSLTAFAGYLIASPVFIAGFLRIVGKTSMSVAIGCGAGTAAVLWLLGGELGLELPAARLR